MFLTFGSQSKQRHEKASELQKHIMRLKHIFTSAKKCKGMNPNTFKWISTLGIVVLWLYQIFVTKVHIENLVSIQNIEKVFKWRYWKWTCILQLEIESSSYELNCVLTLVLGLWSMLGHKREWKLGECVETHMFESRKMQKRWVSNILKWESLVEFQIVLNFWD
jgi:hypothetical protein